MRVPELLAPAGNLEKALLALDFGADAVYIGGKAFSLRARASNFDIDQIKQTCDYARQTNKKVYVATNVVCHNALLRGFADYALKLKECGVTGCIIADPYIFDQMREHAPDIERHISTQQSVTNSKAAMFWQRQGAHRVVLAREVAIDELRLLMKHVAGRIEIEYFVHGAVCIAFSGRCQMSSNFSHRDANVGGCAHSCRWHYQALSERGGPQYKSFTMSPKDMALMRFLPELIDLGVSCFKIEGRMKSLHYVATIVNSYKKAIDEWAKQGLVPSRTHLEEIAKAANRPADIAFYHGSPGIQQMLYREGESEQARQEFAFQVVDDLGDNRYAVLTRNNFATTQSFEAFGPSAKSPLREVAIVSITRSDGSVISTSNRPMEEVVVKTDVPLYVRDIARIRGSVG